MNIIGAIIAGIIGTLIITGVMAVGPKMGMPEMDIVGMLGSMFAWPPNRILGWVVHLMMGIVFAVIYAALWNAGVLGGVSIVSGLVFGIVHWLVAGAMFAVMPMMHHGIQNGHIPEPGAFMLKSSGAMGFAGGLTGHMIFGIVVALVYGFFV